MSSTTSQDRAIEAAMSVKLNEARSHIASNRFSRAVESIQSAVLACGCGTRDLHLNKRSCNITQFFRAVQSTDAEALETLVRSPCLCGLVWPSCTRGLHARAIDELVECLDQAGRVGAALSVALGLVRLDLASPMGFCRALKILRRLAKNPASDPAVPQDPTLAQDRAAVARDAGLAPNQSLGILLKPLARRGLYSVGKRRDRRKTQYHCILNKMAHAMGMVESKRDPVQELPRETLTQIFSYLDHNSLLRSVRVSKRWAQVLNQDTVLWDELLLGHPGNPGQAHFVEFLKKHRNIKTFGVTEVRDFVLATSKVRAILALPRVQRLRFSTSRPPLPQIYAYGMLKDLPKNKLTHIRVFGMSLVLVKELIAWNRESLQVLDITDQILPDWHNFCNLGYFGQLRKLRLIGSKTSRGGVSMNQVLASCPQLQHLYIDGIELAPLHAAPSHEGWKSLRSIVLGPHTRLTPRLFAPFLAACIYLESIEILIPGLTAYCASLFATGANDGSTSIFDAEFDLDMLNFTYLRVFRCHSALSPELLQHILAPAVANGALEVLELSMGHSVYSPHINLNPNVNGPIIPLRDYTFTISNSVRTLGLYDFNWAPHANSTAFEGGPFIEWLRCFPNVDAISIYPGPYSSAAMTSIIRPLLEFSQLKAIFQDRLTGVDWDQATRAAKAHGMRIYHLKDLIAPKWQSFD